MRLFKKKDKRYNKQLDNYSDKYADTFKLGLFYVIVGLVGYGIYKIYTFFS